MGVDYSAYAVVGKDVSKMEGTEFYNDFYATHENEENDDPTETLESKWGVSLYYFNWPYSGDWENCTVGYNVGGGSPEDVAKAFTKFKDKFGVEGRLQAAMVIW